MSKCVKIKVIIIYNECICVSDVINQEKKIQGCETSAK